MVIATDNYKESPDTDNDDDQNDFSTDEIHLSSNTKFTAELEQLAKRTNVEFEEKLSDDTLENFF
jgi:hypothetical protein